MGIAKAKGVRVEGHDDGRTFPYDQRGPLLVLKQLEDLPVFKDDEGFKTLKKFIEQRAAKQSN